jgi:hypothetical protein
LLALFLLCAFLCAQTQLLPLKDIRAGMRGIGKTVFSGNQIEEFQVEVLGILENAGPKQAIILGRLSGGPLERTGVMQGMSGSPVYIDGKLAGAVALAFSFAKEPIAGIRPIEEMIVERQEPRRLQAAFDFRNPNLTSLFPKPIETSFGDAKLAEITTPVSFGGFTPGTLEHFWPQLRTIGLEPRQGFSGGGRPTGPSAGTGLEPGAMISVQLMTGDLSIGADGTITHVDGNRVYAFGHRFLSVGNTELPFARSEVLTLLPNLSTSFKISSAREWMGTITGDYSTAITGELGRRADLVPLTVSLTSAGAAASAKPLTYEIQMVNDRFLSPLLLQMAIYSAIDATERTVGAASFSVQGEIQFDGATPPVRIRNIFSGDLGAPAQASLSAAVPVAFALQSGLENLKLKRISIAVAAFDEKKQLQVDQVWASRREARPGDEVELTTLLAGENGEEVSRKISYTIPEGMRPGALFFTVADSTTANVTDYQQWIGRPQRSPSQLVELLNSLRGNTKAYVRVWKGEPGFQIEGKDLPDPPPSLALILARQQSSPGVVTATAGSKVAELEIEAGTYAITGSKTVQIEVIE